MSQQPPLPPQQPQQPPIPPQQPYQHMPPTAVMPPQPQPVAKPPKRRWYASRWFVGVVAGLLGLAIGAGAGGKGSSGDASSATATATATVTATVTAKATVTASAPAAPVTTAPKPANVIKDGKHEVGVDIQPGTYKGEGEMCYWARLKGASGELSDIIANGNGPGIVTIDPTDKYFETRMCSAWTKRG